MPGPSMPDHIPDRSPDATRPEKVRIIAPNTTGGAITGRRQGECERNELKRAREEVMRKKVQIDALQERIRLLSWESRNYAVSNEQMTTSIDKFVDLIQDMRQDIATLRQENKTANSAADAAAGRAAEAELRSDRLGALLHGDPDLKAARLMQAEEEVVELRAKLAAANRKVTSSNKEMDYLRSRFREVASELEECRSDGLAVMAALRDAALGTRDAKVVSAMPLATVVDKLSALDPVSLKLIQPVLNPRLVAAAARAAGAPGNDIEAGNDASANTGDQS